MQRRRALVWAAALQISKPTLPAELTTTQTLYVCQAVSVCSAQRISVPMMRSQYDALFQFRHCSTTPPVPPRDAKSQQTLKDAFNELDVNYWGMFTSAFPNWDNHQTGISQFTIESLVNCGISRLDSIILFAALADYWMAGTVVPGGGDLQKLQDAFNALDPSYWGTFTSKFDDWQEILRSISEDTILAVLQQPPLSMSFLDAADLSTALAKYFESRQGTLQEGLYDAIIQATLVKNKAVVELTLSNFSWLTHEKSANITTVFVREVYITLWTVVRTALTSGDDVLMIGNPGIGKSWSLNYLLYMALREKLTSLVLLRTRGGWYSFFEGECRKHTEFPGADWVNSKLGQNERGLLLHDVGAATDNRDLHFQGDRGYGNVCIVLVSAPNEANYKGFTKQCSPKRFYCPILSEDEFLSIHPTKLAEFKTYGGSLRDVGSPTREEKLKDQLQSFNYSRVSLDLININDSHRIVQVVPTGIDNSSYEIAFVSKEVEKRFVDIKYPRFDC